MQEKSIALKTFSLFTIFVFVAELFSPFAFAADATPTPTPTPVPPTSTIPYPAEIKSGESCIVSVISDAERQTLWDNTATAPIQQLTDVPLEAALNQQGAKVLDPLSPNASLNPAPALTVFDQQITLSSLQVFGIPKDKLLKYVQGYDAEKDNADEVLQNTAVTLAQAQEIMRRENRGGTASQRLDDYINKLIPGANTQATTPQLPQGPTQPYSDLKVILPGPVGSDGKQREITYNQIAAVTALKPDSCLLQGTIKGRVSYMGILGSDLTYGIPGNQTLSGQYIYPPSGQPDEELIDPRSNQWFVGKSLISFLSLNGGANILIPSFYEDWTAFTGKWAKVDLYVSLGLGIAATSAKQNLEKIQKLKSELREGVLQSPGARGDARMQNFLLDRLEGRIEKRTVPGAGEGLLFKNANNEERIIRVESRTTGGVTQDNVVIYDTAGGTRYAEPIGMPGQRAPDDVIQAQGLEAERTHQGLEFEVQETAKKMRVWDQIKKSAVPRVSYNLMMGAAWMGPARLAYDIADRNFFAASGFNQDKYLKVFADRNVAEKFRGATNLLGIGAVQEILSEYTGTTPTKAFKVGRVYLANYPAGTDDSRESTTTISSGDQWSLTTRWKGSSFSVNFEDVLRKPDEKYASLPMVTNQIIPDAVINRKTGGSAVSYLLTLATPFLIFRRLVPEVGQSLGIAGALLAAEEVWTIDPNNGKGAECDAKELERLKNWYRSWIAADYALTALTAAAVPGLSGFTNYWRQFSFAGRVVSDIQAWANPFLIAQWVLGNEVQTYVANCKDSQYKILAYQRLPEATQRTNQTASEKATNAVQDVTQGFANTFGGGGDKVKNELAKYTEILNLKTQMQDQQGFVQPDEIVAVHIEKSAWMVPGGVFDTLNGTGCNLEETLPTSDGGALSITKNGLKKFNKDGSVAFDFNDFYWKLRAASILRSQELARMIVPNKIITTVLDCGDQPFISISASGSSALVGRSCGAGGCLEKQLKTLVDFDGSNLEKVIGRITSVDTTLGTTSFTGDSIMFTRTSFGEAGVATRAPSLEEAARSVGLGSASAGVSLDILGNGEVTMYSPRDFGTEKIGTLKTIIGEKGKIEYDPVVKRLFVFIYVLGDGKAQTISDVVAKASSVNSNGKIIPVINLDLRGKTGFEDVVKQLRDALAQIQKDSKGGAGGVQIIETPDKIYKFNPDGTLTITDKKTGATETLKITGAPTTDANGNVVFPTDKGSVAFGTGLNAQGQPIININGGGLKESGTLEAAKGPGGIFTFNPSTGSITVYNGQDLPMDPRFATQGMSFVGTPEGTRGVPAVNPFALSPQDDSSFQRRKQSLLLPSWPAEALWFAAMLGIVMLGVLFVRTRRLEE
ncbi:hypothetical protein J4220_02745 [Candidatus Micrarchaeota archaeon]|nr:hypothetical protein [Candidatus Micrarchaeota archaeon]